VVGLAFGGGYAVNVHAGQSRVVGNQESAGLFQDFPARGIGEGGVGWFDVAAGEEPAIEAAVVDEEDAIVVGGEDESGGGDVSGRELLAGEGVGRALEDHEDELARFEGGAIGGVVESADEGGDGGGVHGSTQCRTVGK